MDLWISHESGQPIYEQIVSQIKGMILSGELQDGDALPSMRLLAKELKISVITTKRAYEELLRAGLIVSVTGKGSFVSTKNANSIREEQQKALEAALLDAARQAKSAGVSLSEVLELITLLYKGE